ncbi:MAG: metallophosphoesterase family protein [Anaeromyxobacter sp.]
MLAAIAPVTAVRGNNDHAPSFWSLPETAVVELGALRALVIHDLGDRGKPHPLARGMIAAQRPQLVIHGHSHRPEAVRLDGTLYVNPGSAGPRRFSLPRTAALLEVEQRQVELRFYDLSGQRPRPFGKPVREAF